MYRDDYERAGYRMLPRFDLDSRFTRAEIVAFTIALVVLTLVPMLSHGGLLYLGAMALAGGFFLYHSLKLAASSSKVLASRLLHASVIYLPVALGILAIGK
jgi:heme O synthase-like polyprenyltransferase